MTVYQGEEVSIEVDPSQAHPETGVIWIKGDDIDAGTLVAINWIDVADFTEELSAVIEKYKI